MDDGREIQIVKYSGLCLPPLGLDEVVERSPGAGEDGLMS